MKNIIPIGWVMNFFTFGLNLYAYFNELAEVGLANIVIGFFIIFIFGGLYLLNQKEHNKTKENWDDEFYL